ncbi:MAG: 2-isopropylmalate synthase [Arenicellales bacterium]|jgi:2-isopropylmalate synthase|nr:2-isopropylmalate synthase [Arenicellales bacterium]|tara:strand:+ start:21191 stop:22738 length:1548 start_codon:yes stop_codon:yes gene_type:complete
MTNKLIVFDTTLRDGEQSPGASMTADEKMRLARQLERLRVDVIEAGFPAASPGDFEAVQRIAEQVRETTICGLARANARDVGLAADAVKPAESPRIHTFIATSPIHMREKLRMSPDQVLEQAVLSVKQAKNSTGDVEFSPEDAGRSDEDFLCQILEAVIDAGATTINIPDTVGYTMPSQFGELVANLMERIPNSDKAIFSVHCHNDLGMAVANSLAAVMKGARQVECTVNGLGERAGNASLEEIVMAVRTRQDFFDCDTNVDSTQIVPTSRLVSTITGFPVQPNKAIVGANAFAHEAGIHQDGVLKSRETYEIMRAEDVGWSANKLVLGKHSGRTAFTKRLVALGIEFESKTDRDEAFVRFKTLADKKHEIFDEDLIALVSESDSEQVNEKLQLVSLSASSITGEIPKAVVTLSIDGTEKTASATGDGAVDASYKAVEAIAPSESKLLLYSVNNITTGTDAQGEVSVRLEKDGRIVNGSGADTDIVIASVKAYVNALNRLNQRQFSVHPQLSDTV